MTLQEAESVVGRPSTDIAALVDYLFMTRRIRWVAPAPHEVLHEGSDWSNGRPDLARIRCWDGANAGLTVQLGDDGRIIGKRFEGKSRMALVDRLRLMLPW